MNHIAVTYKPSEAVLLRNYELCSRGSLALLRLGYGVTLYVTDTTTGEMTPLDLSGLRRVPTGSVKRVRQTHFPARKTTYHPPRQYKQASPISDLLVGLAGVVAATVALSVPFLT